LLLEHGNHKIKERIKRTKGGKLKFIDNLAWEVAKYWTRYASQYSPSDYVDFWLGMAIISDHDYLTYTEVTGMTNDQITMLQNSLSVIINQFNTEFTKFTKNNFDESPHPTQIVRFIEIFEEKNFRGNSGDEDESH
jgi:hypothetical protein